LSWYVPAVITPVYPLKPDTIHNPAVVKTLHGPLAPPYPLLWGYVGMLWYGFRADLLAGC